MQLIGVYVILAIIGAFISFFLGQIVDRVLPDYSMIIFMAMFFGNLWLMWPIAVRITEKYILRETA
ncbi:hypothetical protein [Leptospira sp. severe_002]|uniref:hypothetical protein n=1 Tax=Leptospira sp. severe_002 TaxID=2838237 RepID=UPI001E581BB7|nr:hypothetical protein [Leptospira sp. severe_002]